MPIATPMATWSRLIRFISNTNQIHFGEPIDPEMDIGLAIANGQTVTAHIFDAILPWDKQVKRTGETAVVKKLLSPISKEMCGTIRATGLAYKDHAAEMNLPFPQVPVLFFKPPNSLTDPNSTVIVPHCAQNDEMDYEVELAIVLGQETKDVSEKEAMSCILGYTCANDLTARKHQMTSSQWGYAKGFDQFCPVGPCLVSARDIPDPHEVILQTKLNGEVMQDGSARKMIFSIAKVISYLSQGTSLPAGTIIITGTPPGIGDGRSPKVWVKDGDHVECYISHGIGTLVNDFEYE